MSYQEYTEPEVLSQDEFRAMMERNRIEAMFAAGKKSEYTKAKIIEYGPHFWRLMEARAMSDDIAQQETFLKEYAKLAAKNMPTEIAGPGGSNPFADLMGHIALANQLAPVTPSTTLISQDNVSTTAIQPGVSDEDPGVATLTD